MHIFQKRKILYSFGIRKYFPLQKNILKISLFAVFLLLSPQNVYSRYSTALQNRFEPFARVVSLQLFVRFTAKCGNNCLFGWSKNSVLLQQQNVVAKKFIFRFEALFLRCSHIALSQCCSFHTLCSRTPISSHSLQQATRQRTTRIFSVGLFCFMSCVQNLFSGHHDERTLDSQSHICISSPHFRFCLQCAFELQPTNNPYTQPSILSALFNYSLGSPIQELRTCTARSTLVLNFPRQFVYIDERCFDDRQVFRRCYCCYFGAHTTALKLCLQFAPYQFESIGARKKMRLNFAPIHWQHVARV